MEVDYYGAITPLKQLAHDLRHRGAAAHDHAVRQESIKAIEKAILESDVGLTPSNDGQLIRLQIPELTEERRKELVKVVRGIAEEGRVAVRNIRRDVMHDLRELRARARSAPTTSTGRSPSSRSSRTPASPRSTPRSPPRKHEILEV